MVESKTKRFSSGLNDSYKLFLTIPVLVIILALIFHDSIANAVFGSNKDIHLKVNLREIVFDSVSAAVRTRNESPPVGWDKRASASARAAELDRQKLIGKSILWIDDEPRNNTFLQNAFAAAGIKVFQALTNREALDLIAQSKFDLVITDINRDKNERTENGPTKGLELIPVINRVGMPVIIYSASWSGEHEGQEDQFRASLITNDPTKVYAFAISSLVR